MSRPPLESLRPSPAALWRRWLAPRRPARERRPAPAPALEPLEDRTAPATFTVTTLADVTAPGDGAVSLREAITSANDEVSHPGADAITFAVTGTINLTGPLPDLGTNLAIQGPGAGSLTVRRDSGGDYRIFNVPAGATVILSGLTVANGRPATRLGYDGGGAGIRNAGTLTVRHCIIAGNANISSGASVSAITNTIHNGGGGIHNEGVLAVSHSTVSGNSASCGGGISNSGTLTLSDSTISGNSAQSGAGIFNIGTLTVSQCTVSGNSATLAGGGVTNAYNATATLVNTTVTDNRSDALGHGFGQGAGVFKEPYTWAVTVLHNTLVAGNFMGTGTARQDVAGDVHPSSSFNLIGVGTGLTGLTHGTNGNLIGTDASPIDPRLAPLGDYGGLTKTHALLLDSPAIDAGDVRLPGDTDQRGLPRAAGRDGVGTAPDIGAYEVQSAVVTTLQDTANPHDAFTSLREAITAANLHPEDETITFAAGLTGTLSLTSALPDLSGTLAIEGPGAKSLTVQRTAAGPSAPDFRVFTVARGATVSLSGLTIANGRADFGGGIYNAGTLTVSHSTLADNAAPFGGGIFNEGALTVRQSTLARNAADAGGGILSAGALTVRLSTLSANTARAGGGLYLLAGRAEVSQATLTANVADRAAAGAGDGGGAFCGAMNFCELSNTLVAGNFDTPGNAGPGRIHPDVSGSFTSGGHNLIGDGTGSTGFGSPGDQVGTAAARIDPRLGPLQDNGGPTRTHALLAGSPAIDRGGAVAGEPDTDQRGRPRIDDFGSVANAPGGDGRDIGAFEARASATLRVNSTADSNTRDLLLTLREALLVATGAMSRESLAPEERAQVTEDPGVEDTITLGVTGAIDLAGALPDLSGSLTLRGPGADRLTVRRSTAPGTPAFRVFNVPGGATVALSGLTVANGLAPEGGGIRNLGTLTVTACALADNRATSSSGGGGLRNYGTLTVRDSTLSHNTSGSWGGGIDNVGTLVLQNSTLSDNSAFLGGGLSNNGDLTLRASTLSGNRAALHGGGLFHHGGAAAVDHATITNNQTEAGDGGGIFASGGAVSLRNSLVAGNRDLSGQGAPGVRPDVSGGFTSGGHNLIGDGSGGAGFTADGDRVGTTAQPIDPRLGPLADNGGPTRTHALLAGSPAIDAGIASAGGPTADQRGVAYYFAADIGAFEAVPPDTAIVSRPPPISFSRTAAFTFAGTDDWTPAGELAFLVSLDGGPAQRVTGGVTFAGLANGFHTVQVWAVDRDGHVDPTPAVFTWFVFTLPSFPW